MFEIVNVDEMDDGIRSARDESRPSDGLERCRREIDWDENRFDADGSDRRWLSGRSGFLWRSAGLCLLEIGFHLLQCSEGALSAPSFDPVF